MTDINSILDSLGIDLNTSISQGEPEIVHIGDSPTSLPEVCITSTGGEDTQRQEATVTLGDSDISAIVDTFMEENAELDDGTNQQTAVEEQPETIEVTVENVQDHTQIETQEYSEEDNTQEEGNEEPSVLLDENSPTLMMDDSSSRFSGTEWYEAVQKKNIILAGLGGIGSWAALLLGRTHPALILMYDDDTVESSNMSGQLFGVTDVGCYKADVVSRTLNSYVPNVAHYSSRGRFELDTPAGHVMICGFDNMESRKKFFLSWKNYVRTAEDKNQCLFMDGRLSVDTLQIFCITGDDDYNIRRYEEEYLFDDSQADAVICSLKQTSYMAAMIGSMIANLFVNFVANTLNPVIPYSLPFFTEYDSKFMLFKSES